MSLLLLALLLNDLVRKVSLWPWLLVLAFLTLEGILEVPKTEGRLVEVESLVGGRS